MPDHDIASVARLTALSPLTIRAWESRHAIVAPRRNARGHRVYTDRDVMRLTLMARATRQGHRVGEIARLPNSGLRRLVDAGDDRDRSAAAARLRHEILSAIENYDIGTVQALLGASTRRLAPLEAVSGVFQPVLHEVGNRWHAGTLSVAQEHLLSTAVAGAIYAELHAPRPGGRDLTVLCGTLEGEDHGLGSLLIGYLAGTIGYQVHLVGTDLPASEFRRILGRMKPVLTALSVVTDESAARLPAQLRTLCQDLSENARIVIGGRSSAALRGAALPAQCRVLQSAEAFVDLLLDG